MPHDKEHISSRTSSMIMSQPSTSFMSSSEAGLRSEYLAVGRTYRATIMRASATLGILSRACTCMAETAMPLFTGLH